MNAATVEVLRGVRWLVLLSLTWCTLYVLVSAFTIFAWGPYQACQAGRCYLAHNWDYLLENFLSWHIVTLTVCVTLVVVVWQYKVPDASKTDDASKDHP